MFEKSYDMAYYSVYNLLEATDKMANDFYDKNIERIMINNQFNTSNKYEFATDIMNIYTSILKYVLKYHDIILRYRYMHDSNSDFLKKTEKMLSYQNSISGYFYNQILVIKSVNIRYNSQALENKSYPDSKDEERIQIFKYVLKTLDNFKTSQLELFNKEKVKYLEKFGDIEYENIFNKLLDRYIIRLRYIKWEKIRIKFGNYIDINYYIQNSIKNIDNYISECAEKDINYNIFN